MLDKQVHVRESAHWGQTQVFVPQDTFNVSLFTLYDTPAVLGDGGDYHHRLILRFIKNRQGDIIQGNQEPTVKVVWQKHECGPTHSFDLPYEEFWKLLTDALAERCEQICPEGNPGPNTLAHDEVG